MRRGRKRVIVQRRDAHLGRLRWVKKKAVCSLVHFLVCFQGHTWEQGKTWVKEISPWTLRVAKPQHVREREREIRMNRGCAHAFLVCEQEYPEDTTQLVWMALRDICKLYHKSLLGKKATHCWEDNSLKSQSLFFLFFQSVFVHFLFRQFFGTLSMIVKTNHND